MKFIILSFYDLDLARVLLQCLFLSGSFVRRQMFA